MNTSTVVLGLVLYVPLTGLVYHKVRFRPLARILFALTLVPVCLGAMFLSLEFVTDAIPAFWEIYESSKEIRHGLRSGDGLVSLFVAGLPTILAGVVWYRLFRLIDGRGGSPLPPPTTTN